MKSCGNVIFALINYAKLFCLHNLLNHIVSTMFYGFFQFHIFCCYWNFIFFMLELFFLYSLVCRIHPWFNAIEIKTNHQSNSLQMFNLNLTLLTGIIIQEIKKPKKNYLQQHDSGLALFIIRKLYIYNANKVVVYNSK